MDLRRQSARIGSSSRLQNATHFGPAGAMTRVLPSASIRLIPLLVGAILTACGGSQTQGVTAAVGVGAAVSSPTVTVTPVSQLQLAAIESVRAFASKLGKIQSIAAVSVDAQKGSAVVEVLFDNNVRQIFLTTLGPDKQWTVITAANAAVLGSAPASAAPPAAASAATPPTQPTVAPAAASNGAGASETPEPTGTQIPAGTPEPTATPSPG